MKAKDLKFWVVDRENFEHVLYIKHTLFPESNTDKDYDKHFKKLSKCNYYLITEGDKPCATIGWYDFDDNGKEGFVGWFGVLPEFQRRGIGTKALEFITNEVKKKGYKFLRVYTDKVVNYASTKLYDKMFDFVEDYSYPDKLGRTNNFVVYTKVLDGKKEKWSNRPLNEDDNYEF